MLDIKATLTDEEIILLRECLDRRSGTRIACEAMGVSRGTIWSVSRSGFCSKDTATKIRKFLKSQTVKA